MPYTRGGSLRYNAGAPSAGTDEVQTLANTGTVSGGTFKLQYEGLTTVAIAFNASAATIQTALRALTNIGSTGVNCAGGALPTPVTCTFQFDQGRKAVPMLVLVENALTGTNPLVTITESTPGVDATHRGAPTGTLLSDTTNGKLYIQTSSNANAPTWTVVGTQT